MPAPIVPRPRIAAGIAVVAVVALVALGLPTRDAARGLPGDGVVTRWIEREFGARLLQALLDLTTPALVVGLLAVLALGALIARRLDIVALVVAAPLVTTGLTEYVLKPLFHRTNPATTAAVGEVVDAYPSGHESLVASFLVLAVLLALRSSLSPVVRAAVVVAAALYFVGSAVGLVGYFYHYPSDTIGSLLLALAVVLGGGLALDRATR